MHNFQESFILVRSPILVKDQRKLLDLTAEQTAALNETLERLTEQFRAQYASALSAAQDRARHMREVTAKIEDELRSAVEALLTPEQRKLYSVFELLRSGAFRVRRGDD